MSAIDELKDGIVIDATGSDNDDAIKVNKEGNKVDLSSFSGNKKTVVKPKGTPETTAGPRKVIDIASVAAPEPEDPNIHRSLEHDLLDLEDPNSMLNQYVKNEVIERAEMKAEAEEERRVLAMEEEEEEASKIITESDENIGKSLVTDFEDDDFNKGVNIDITSVETEDISGLLDDEEEEKDMAEDIVIDTTEDEDLEDITDIIDDTEEDVPEPVEAIAKNIEDSFNNKENSSKEEEKKEEVEEYDASDIDVDDSDKMESFATEIIEEDEEVTEDTDSEDVLKHLQKLATEKLKPVSKKLDIKSFTVLKKPVTNVTPIFQDQKARVVKWVLPSQESVVFMREFSGAELEKLREYSENSRSIDSLNRRFKMIYDHIVEPKPANFETWLKTTPFEDTDHYFFAIYVASFKGANFLPEDCINKDCNETFLTDDINIMDMVKFDTKEAKKKFADLYQSESTPAGKGVYCTEVVPVSARIAIAFRQPSIYNVFEIASIDDKTRTNYSSVIEYIPYIDTIYLIDEANQSLVPITYKMFADNAQRNIKSKIQKYENIFSTLSVDEFGIIKAYVRAISEQTTGMRYVYPSVTCPKCGTATNEQRATAEELVFTRYQLGALVSTSLS